MHKVYDFADDDYDDDKNRTSTTLDKNSLNNHLRVDKGRCNQSAIAILGIYDEWTAADYIVAGRAIKADVYRLIMCNVGRAHALEMTCRPVVAQ